MGPNENYRSSLHTFCDTSDSAYAAAVFLRVETYEGVKTILLQARSRVAPIKKTSIPRLELLATTIGARLAISVQETLNVVEDVYFWTNPTTVLGWIKRRQEWSTFVWNRVKEIREHERRSMETFTGYN
ncbi:uncharacterized protein [Onthophagus taurus]|uniref:uncharacterized protein n=1 Tax=Onthophagus taurus TaxID=166361 RepID=UPI0039BE1926